MRILYISTIFPKENEGSTIYTDLAEELTLKGHQVVVAVADSQVKENSLKKERGIPVLRIKVKPYYNVSYFKKGIAALTMNKKLTRGIQKIITNDVFDFILFESPPVTLYQTVRSCMYYYDCPSYLMLKDIFPQNGVDLGLYKKNGLIHAFFQRKERSLYQTATYIGCMSEANREYLIKHNPYIDSSKVKIFPNTKKIKERVFVKNKNLSYRKKYQIPQEAVVFVFGGNMGKPQAIDFLVQAVIRLKDEKNIFFLLVGRGSEKEKAKKELNLAKAKNFRLIDNLPRKDYEALIQECDVGLILLDHRFTIPNYPSRVLSYMEQGMPVIAATDRVTDILKMIKESRCGLTGYSDEMDVFINNIHQLAQNKEKRVVMGNNGRKYLEKSFDICYSIQQLEQLEQQFSLGVSHV